MIILYNFHITSFFGNILELHIMVGAQDIVQEQLMVAEQLIMATLAEAGFKAELQDFQTWTTDGGLVYFRYFQLVGALEHEWIMTFH